VADLLAAGLAMSSRARLARRASRP